MRRPSALIVGISSLMLALLLAGCGGGNSSSSAANITITLTASGSQTIDQGQAVNVTAALDNDTSSQGVSWSLNGLGTLANKTSTSVTYQAPASVSTIRTATVTATSVADNTQFSSISFTVNPPPAITSTSLPDGTAGTAYSGSLTESGGTAPFTWTVTAGQIPPGLTLNTSSGLISGTPTGAGTFDFSVSLSDEAGLTSSADASIVIAPPPPLAVSTTLLPNATVNLSYTDVLRGTGGVAPYTWIVSQGSLPAGLQLSNSGVISGTPTVTGTFSFTVQITDSETPTAATATQTLSLIVNPVAFSISTTSLPNGTVTIAYSTTLKASGGVAPITWSIASGALPSWATLDPSTGIISGTPDATGTTDFTVQATDAESPAALALQPLSITITSTQNALLSGHYAFVLGGYGGGLAGSFIADGNGNITGGAEDLEAAGKSLSATNLAITSGSYAIGGDNRGTLSYTDADHNTFTFDIALGSAAAVSTKGSMIETDANGTNFTGSLALQNPSAFSTSSISGAYTFALSGWDGAVKPDVVVGSATVSGGVVSAGLLDENDAGTLASSVAFTGTASVDSSGRGSFTATATQANFAFYVVASGQWLAIASDPGTGAVLVGKVEQQSGVAFSAGSVSGKMVFQSQTSTATPAPQATVGLLASTGDGNATYTVDIDAGGALSSQTGTATLDFSTASNGRFTLTPDTGDAIVGYMVTSNKAYFLGTGAIPSFGTFEPQTSGTFTSSSLYGSFYFGSLPLVSAPSSSQAPAFTSGIVSFDGQGGLTGVEDSNQGGTVTTRQLTESYSVASNGRVTIVPGEAIIYIVSSSKAIALSIYQPDFTNPFIEVIQR